MNNQTALIIFAREPKVGCVKTRLLPHFPAEVVTDLYKAFVQDVLAMASEVACDQRYLFYASDDGNNDFLNQFSETFSLKKQIEGDLGERMFYAGLESQSEGSEKTLIIGTDCLTITPDDVAIAYSQLEKFDYVLGPSKDGGYYLIGFKSPDRNVFTNVNWGTDTVLEQTMEHIRSINQQVFLLEEKEDIDTLEALQSFSQNVEAAHRIVKTQKIISDPKFNLENPPQS